jgi:copper transport protein
VNWRARSTWLIALFAVCFSVFIPAGAANAHAGLEESEPKPSSWLATSPTEIVLHFDESVGVVFARIKILDQDGNEVFEAKPTRDASDHTTVRANIDKLGDGTWVVVWRVASADSHPVQGSFAFSIGTSSSDVTALLNGSVSARHGLNNLFNLIRFVMFAGVLTLIGGVALVMFGAKKSPSIRTRISLWGAWLFAIVASIEALFAYGPHASGVKVFNVTDLSLLGDTMSTLFGQATLLRISLLLGFSLLLLTIDYRSRGWWKASVIGASVAIAATFSAVGHPSGQSPVALSVTLDVVHLLAVSLWIGALFLIAIDRKFWLRSTQSMLWFSRVAGYSVAVIVVTGIAQTVLLMDGLGNLFVLEFGQKLVVKVALVLVLVAIGALSRSALRKSGPAKLHQSVVVEALIALIVVGITALIVALPPREQASNAPVEFSLEQSGLIADVTVTPAQIGTAEIHVSVVSLVGSFVQMTEITGRMSLPSENIPNGPIEFTRTGPNHYTAVVNFAFSGKWHIEFLVKPDPSRTVLFATDVKVGE